MLASGSRSGAIKICDLESQKGTRINSFFLKTNSSNIFIFLVIHPGGHKTCIRSIEYFPSSNNFLATAAVDGTAKVR